MTVRTILTAKGRNVVSADPNAALSAVMNTLAQKRIGAVLMLSKSGKIEGILSERDIVRVISERGASVLDQPASTAMTHKVIACRETDTVAHVMDLMTAGKFRHLPVVEDGKVVGMISIGDAVKYRLGEYESEQEALKEYIKTA